MTTPQEMNDETDTTAMSPVSGMSALSIRNEPSLFDDATLASITSWKEAGALLDRMEVAPESASDYGTGFKVVDKATLVGVPFLILEWRFSQGDFGPFVSVSAVTKHDDKVIFNDGSSGVRQQLQTVTDQRRERGHAHPQAGLVCEEGLTKTSYFANAKTGETSNTPQTGDGWGPASTYYIAD